MAEQHRSDYVYRAAIASKIFLGRHSPATTTLLSEFRVLQTRVDLLMLNGTSTAYEIKSELDGFGRLANQLATYAVMFDRIYVVTEPRLLKGAGLHAPPHVGIISLTPRFSLSVEREASSNRPRLSVDAIVDALRLRELSAVTKDVCGGVPEVGSARLFSACKAELCNRDPGVVHDAALKVLKKRQSYSRRDFESVPDELVPAFMDSKVPAKLWPMLVAKLNDISLGDILEVS